ncbi:hypothetical protein N473_07125 [Pseudoalteromonas luteoviolacea CPMOR-1]|uniref:Carrier domain-containing protein n=1 Tax=Pseudoalteromonas luteoviolacea CPMOR-1 TaxID=1365248 RepID=A0A167NFR3_9GAMM|nr:phosphopantetheine-binding protein [Pseudoalteromonas luteoviolacea]KZN68188.1 hypothetical protein N473_07125 [Pseudoalteromonas luteoviolacea CPMOR-1]
MEYAVVIIILLIVAFMWARVDDKKREAQIDKIFEGRDSLEPEEFYEKYYGSTDISKAIVVDILVILETVLEIELSRLLPSDDFSQNLRYLFEFDSMADVDLVESLERKFLIKISDIEAENIKTIEDLVMFVSNKVNCT